MNQLLQKIRDWLDRQPIFGILDKLGKLSILVAVLGTAFSYQKEKENARRAKHYQAWQLINQAAGTTGNGGRVEAIADLIRDGVSLRGVNLENAWLLYADFTKGDFGNGNFAGAKLIALDFHEANLGHSNLQRSVLADVNFQQSDLEGANLSDATLLRVDLAGANIKNANLSRIKGVDCSLLKAAKYWETTTRDGALDCGASAIAR